MHAFGLQDVGSMFLIRIGYILIGASIGYLANCLIFPYKRARATRQLWKKYTSVTELLSRITRKQQIDSQLYYNLVVQSYLLEEKLGQNANFEKWEEFPKVLSAHQKKIPYVHKNSN